MHVGVKNELGLRNVVIFPNISQT